MTKATERRTWPFVARVEVAQRITAAIESSRHVIINGPAGLGKTRLATEVVAHFARLGVVTHRVVASPAGASLPLAPYAALAGDTTGGDVVPAVLRALDADGRSGPGDPVLVVDDLHLLDEASAIVTHQLVLSGKVRVIATTRSSAQLPQAATRLRNEPSVDTVDLEPLSDDEIVDMVHRALGAALDARSRVTLTTLSRGNPLYARELIEGAVDAGRLIIQSGVASFNGEIAATPLLEELVVVRLAGLSGEQLLAMELLAVGGRLPHALVRPLVGDDALEQLERAELISTGGDANDVWLDAAHPLHRELMRARLGALARLRIHRTLAAADGEFWAGRAGRGRSAADALRAAVWHMRGGIEIAPQALLAAARHAMQAGDTLLAAELAEEAFRTDGAVDAAMLASWCYAQVGHIDRGIALLMDADATTSDPWMQAAIRLRVAEDLWWSGRLEPAVEYLEGGSRPDGPWNDLVDAQRGVFAMLDGNLPEARRIAEPYADHPHLWVRFVAAVALGNAGIYGDHMASAIEVCGKVVSDAADEDIALLGDANLHVAIQLVAMLHDGQVSAAVEFAELGYAMSADQPSPQVRAWSAMIAGQAMATAGRATDACRYLAEADALWASCQLQGFAGWCAAGLVRAQEESGAHDEAVETLQRVLGYERRGFHLNEVIVDIAQAWVAQSNGDRSAAAEACATAISRAATNEQWTNLAIAWHEAARLGLLGLLPEPDDWQRPRSPLAATRFDMVHAARAGDITGLEAAADAFEDLGCLLYAAEAAALAAALARKAASTKDALRLEGMAGALAQRLGPIATPLLAQRQSSGPLSAREAEIAKLAVDGLTNRQIADRLIVSERTVENHLYRIFIKLGVSARSELADALRN